jgi:spore maturation protein SpmA
MAPLPSDGFLDHYLTGVVYPAGAANLVLALAMLTVLASWCGVVTVCRRHGQMEHSARR